MKYPQSWMSSSSGSGSDADDENANVDSDTSAADDEISDDDQKVPEGGFLRLLRRCDEITKEEFNEIMDKGEVEFASVLRPNISLDVNNEMLGWEKLLGVKVGKDRHIDEDELDMPEISVDDRKFGVKVKYETGTLSVNPLI